MNDLFYELQTSSTIGDILLDFAKSAPESQWQSIREQRLIFVNNSIVTRDPVLTEIMTQFNSGERMMIFKMEPRTVYSWHRDAARVGSINMRLSGSDSVTFLGRIGTNNLRHITDVNYVPYIANKYYLLNVGELHSVINYGNDIRYMFSVSVGPTDDNSERIDFSSILSFIKDKNL